MNIQRGEDPGLVSVKGYPKVILHVREFQPDLSDESDDNDLWQVIPRHHRFGPRQNGIAAICEVDIGEAPDYWETCNPYGHYRVNVKNLMRRSSLEALATTL